MSSRLVVFRLAQFYFAPRRSSNRIGAQGKLGQQEQPGWSEYHPLSLRVPRGTPSAVNGIYVTGRVHNLALLV